MVKHYKDRSTQTVTGQIESLEKQIRDISEASYYSDERLKDALVEANLECERLRTLAMIATVLAVVEFIAIGLMVL